MSGSIQDEAGCSCACVALVLLAFGLVIAVAAVKLRGIVALEENRTKAVAAVQQAVAVAHYFPADARAFSPWAAVPGGRQEGVAQATPSADAGRVQRPHAADAR